MCSLHNIHSTDAQFFLSFFLSFFFFFLSSFNTRYYSRGPKEVCGIKDQRVGIWNHAQISFSGISDQNLSCFWDQGSEFLVPKYQRFWFSIRLIKANSLVVLLLLVVVFFAGFCLSV